MNNRQGIIIEQRQKQVITPKLIQAVNILQMGTADLDMLVKEELLTNPLLEQGVAESGTEHSSDAEDRYSYLKEAQRQENDINYAYAGSFSGGEDIDPIGSYYSQSETLTEHLLVQLGCLDLDDKKKEIGTFIIESLDDNGYLTMEREKIAGVFKVDVPTVDAVLDVLRRFDPAGVAAEDLKQCLMLQVNQSSLGDDAKKEVLCILDNSLEDIAFNSRVIPRKNGIPAERVAEYLEFIRSLEPKPGRQFSGRKDVQYIIPDVLVKKECDGFSVSLNRQVQHHLVFCSYYDELVEEAKRDPSLAEYLSSKVDSAKWLIRNIEQREDTIYRVASTIVALQKDFFENGVYYLSPMTLEQVADILGLHVSTVSRAVSNKYLQTPWGVFEFKRFFSTGYSNDTGKEISAESVKAKIKAFIAGESPEKPLSDLEIAGKLGNEDIVLSRRTVAKYRESLGIPASSKRKKR